MLKGHHIKANAPGASLVGFLEGRASTLAHSAIVSTLKNAGVVNYREVGPLIFSCEHSNSARLFDSLRALAADPSVRFAEPVFTTFEPAKEAAAPDPDFAQQWALELSHASSSWSIERGHPDVIIVVPDQGVELAHSDLAKQILPRDSESWNFIDQGVRSPQESRRPHGTMIAGILAAVHNTFAIAGIAPGCRLMPLKIYGLSLTTATLSDALNYVCDYAEAHTQLSFVVSMSFGIADSEAVHSAIVRAHSLGIAFVASAGNDGVDAPHFPSDYGEVLSIAAVGPDDVLAIYSNFGAKIALCAPGGAGPPPGSGTNILSTSIKGSTESSYGTSFAAPHVAAGLGLLQSSARRNNHVLSPDELRGLITASADDISAMNPTRRGLIGSGRLNIEKALQKLTVQ